MLTDRKKENKIDAGLSEFKQPPQMLAFFDVRVYQGY